MKNLLSSQWLNQTFSETDNTMTNGHMLLCAVIIIALFAGAYLVAKRMDKKKLA